MAREKNLPTPRFVERKLSVDIYREEDAPNRRYSNTSSGSGNIPLTQMDYSVANHNAYQVSKAPKEGESSTSPLGIIPTIPIEGIHLPEDSPKTDQEEEGETHELGWIKSTTHDDNWANPAPHHKQAKFDEE